MTVQKGGWDYFQDGKAGAAGDEGNQTLRAGEEGYASPTLGRTRINNPAHCSTLASQTAAQEIGGASGVPVYIKSIWVSSATAGTITIAGFSTPTAAASLSTTMVIAAGATGNVLPEGIALAFPAGCNITLSTAADGPDIVVAWESMP
jgi:hypothetical protein